MRERVDGSPAGAEEHQRRIFFLFFNPFYSKILKLNSPQLKFQEVAILVVPASWRD
jgi:hypothetical protein